MDERALLFCLLGLLLTVAILLAVAPSAVTWAMSLVVPAY
jgi:hypothetical protein